MAEPTEPAGTPPLPERFEGQGLGFVVPGGLRQDSESVFQAAGLSVLGASVIYQSGRGHPNQGQRVGQFFDRDLANRTITWSISSGVCVPPPAVQLQNSWCEPLITFPESFTEYQRTNLLIAADYLRDYGFEFAVEFLKKAIRDDDERKERNMAIRESYRRWMEQLT